MYQQFIIFVENIVDNYFDIGWKYKLINKALVFYNFDIKSVNLLVFKYKNTIINFTEFHGQLVSVGNRNDSGSSLDSSSYFLSVPLPRTSVQFLIQSIGSTLGQYLVS